MWNLFRTIIMSQVVSRLLGVLWQAIKRTISRL